jgi:dihydroorotase-like cyclic amidohydrolase
VGLETLLPAAWSMTAAPRSQVLGAMTALPARIFGLSSGRLAKARPPTWCCWMKTNPLWWTPRNCHRAPATPPLTAANSKARPRNYVGGECVFERGR